MKSSADRLLSRSMANVFVAGSSQNAADAGARIASEGGNAVDVAIATNLVSMITEIGICALGGGGFITLWPADSDPVTIDGYMEMPGRGLDASEFGQGLRRVVMDYGGGTETLVGHGSVAVPGALAAFSEASRRAGSLPWRVLLEPIIELVTDGFPLSEPSAFYLQYSAESIFGWHSTSREALFRDDRCRNAGELVRVPDLADSLRAIADQGMEAFYQGDLAQRIVSDIRANGGLITHRDLSEYRAVVRPSLQAELDDWHVATNPPPAIGGASLAAMLHLLEHSGFPGWNSEGLHLVIRIQQAVLGYRRDFIDEELDRIPALQTLMDVAEEGDWRRLLTAPSTVHTSSVDDEGNACSITMSAGYGSGVMPPGTGIWMNNSLGELELNRTGLHSLAPGTRLASNMAPTVARSGLGGVLSIGSPGADRITTAVLATLLNHIHLGMPVDEAVSYPRLHVEFTPEGGRVAYEPGLDVDRLGLVSRPFDAKDMFFGGVGVAVWSQTDGLAGAADERRAGGLSMGGPGPA